MEAGGQHANVGVDHGIALVTSTKAGGAPTCFPMTHGGALEVVGAPAVRG